MGSAITARPCRCRPNDPTCGHQPAAEPSERHQWLAGVREQQARRTQQRALRAQLNEARNAGLRRRHETRLARAHTDETAPRSVQCEPTGREQ